MNKREKEVLQQFLDSEEIALAELERQYRRALQDIDRKIRLLNSDELTQSKIYQIEYQKALRGQIEGILEKMHGDEFSTIQKYLHDCYQDGFIGTAYDIAGQGIPLIMPIDQAAAVKAIMTDSKVSDGLYNALGVDVRKLKTAIRQEITRGIATGQTYADIARNISEVSKAPLANAKRIARTEGHRIQQASTFDAQEKAKTKGADVVKQWDSTMDGATRPIHRRLDGQIREVKEPFSMGGKKAMYPGGFGDPAEDCNCRCASLTRARWGLDEAELQTLKDRAKFFGLDKTKDFDDFKTKYLKAAKAEALPDDIASLQSKLTALDKQMEGTMDFGEMARIQTEQDEIRKKIAAMQKEQAAMEKAQTVMQIQDSVVTEGLFKKVDLTNCDTESAQAILAATQKVHSAYPKASFTSLSITDGNMQGSVATQVDSLGKTSGTRIRFNGSYFKDSEKLSGVLEKLYKTNWASTDSIEGMVMHEYGHAICNYYGISTVDIARTVMAESGLEQKAYMGKEKAAYDAVMHISKYGDESTDEWFSECFASVMAGKNPAEVARKAVDVFNRMIAK